MTPGKKYLAKSREILDRIEAQDDLIRKTADQFASSILSDRVVHLFGSGHSRIMVEEMWPRYGSFPGFHPIVELSLSNHNQVVGANGQRQAMYLENVEGFASRILRNFNLDERDSALIISSSGCNVVPIEMAEIFQSRGIFTSVIISKAHANASTSNRSDGKKLSDFADVILDTGAPVGDAMVRIPNLESPVSPGSTLGGIVIINSLKAEVASRLVEAGFPIKVLTASAILGKERSVALFDNAYDQYSNQLSRLLKRNNNE